MIRRPRVWRHMWLAPRAPAPMRPLHHVVDASANDNATPVKALSLDVERWMARQGVR